MKSENWFASWFDTTYYHTLYKHRDDEEARFFIRNLFENLSLKKDSKLLDLACGKGRHSQIMHESGHTVTGADLSRNSIDYAKQFDSSGLEFICHDMREVIPDRQFDVVFNLFTSFGYFDETSDNLRVISAIHEMLNPKGIFVLDFMNVHKVLDHLIEEEIKEIDGIEFHLTRRFNGKHIFKEIRFEDQGEQYFFTERVQALSKSDFEHLLTENNFEILRTFGGFGLESFEEKTSDRLIIIAKKV